MNLIVKKVKEENGWLSCMAAYSVKYNGLEFRTSEALFQWLRFQNHPDIQKEIHDAKSPMGAKMIARKHRVLLNRGENWDESPSDISLMKQCLLLKLEQHPELKEKLIKTEKAVIIEDCTTHDRESARFWGMVYKEGNWIGENVFGKIWMEIREELQEKDGK